MHEISLDHMAGLAQAGTHGRPTSVLGRPRSMVMTKSAVPRCQEHSSCKNHRNHDPPWHADLGLEFLRSNHVFSIRFYMVQVFIVSARVSVEDHIHFSLLHLTCTNARSTRLCSFAGSMF